MFIAAVVGIIAWGTLAFGAVYPWAYTPLILACATVGAVGLYIGRARRIDRPLLLCIIALAVVAAVQLIPLPAGVLRFLSPSTDAYLRSYDLPYSLGGTSHALSIRPEKTLVGLAFIVTLGLFLFGLVRALTRSAARRLAVAVVAFGVVVALIGIIQKAMLGDHAWGGMKIYGFWAPTYLLSTPFGPYVNKNHFAGWMLMGLPLAMGLALGTLAEGLSRHQSGWRSALGWLSSNAGGRFQLLTLGVIVMAVSLLMTKSRSGVGGLAVALIISSAVAARRLPSKAARRLMPASLAAMFVVVFVFAGGDLAARIVAESDAVNLRKNIWTDSARVVRDFPLTGTGLNTFGTAMIVYQSSQTDSHFQEAHNDYLQLAVEGGLLLGVPILMTITAAAFAIRRRFAARRDDPLMYWLRVGASTGLAAVAVQSLVEFSLQMPGNAALFVVLLAIALHHPERPSAASTRKRDAAAH